jgi:hypothetical protein
MSGEDILAGTLSGGLGGMSGGGLQGAFGAGVGEAWVAASSGTSTIPNVGQHSVPYAGGANFGMQAANPNLALGSGTRGLSLFGRSSRGI